MKIAMIGQKGMPALYGGVERHVHELSVRLVEYGHEVTVYARPWYSGRNINKIDGVSIKHLPSIHTKHLDTITHTFLSTVNALWNKFDIIHYHGVGPALLSWIPRIFSPRTNVVVTFHSIDRHQEKWGPISKMFLRIGEWFTCHVPHSTIVISKTLLGHVKKECKKYNAIYIPNGSSIYEKNSKADALDKFDLKKDKYILTVARLIPLKNVHKLVEAFKAIRDENPGLLKGKKLAIVGGGSYSDSYVRSLKQKARGDKDIIFTGFQSGEALSQLFSHAYLMVHPSVSEGLPLTVLEAMSYGLPVLVSDIPGHKELVQANDYIFKAGDLKSLMDALTRLLEKDKHELEIQGEKNKEKVNNNYNWDAIAKDVIKVYEKHLSRATRHVPQAI